MFSRHTYKYVFIYFVIVFFFFCGSGSCWLDVPIVFVILIFVATTSRIFIFKNKIYSEHSQVTHKLTKLTLVCCIVT